MSKKTFDYDKVHYSPELIRQLEDPEYARAAAEYERQARARDAAKRAAVRSGDDFDYEAYESSRYRPAYSYDDYVAARREAGDRDTRQVRPKARTAKAASRSAKASSRSAKASSRPAKASSRQAKGRAQAEYAGGGRSGGGGGGNGKKVKKKKSPFRWVRRIFIILLILIIVLIGYAMSITTHLDRVNTDKEDFAISSSVKDNMSEYRNSAILGSDARKGEGYDGSRTDAIIILSIHKTTGEMKMISVMRDSYLKIAYSDGELFLDKVTHAHAYGGGMDTVAALNRSLDLNIEEFVIFNWKAVADAVDTLGGIEVDVKKNEIDDLNHWGKGTGKNVGKKYHKVKKAGPQTLDGVQAVTYCRIRKNSGGDTGRANRYKTVMSAVLEKTIKNPWKIKPLADTVLPQIRTNMSQTKFMSLMAGVPRYEIKGSVSWPKDYYGGIVGGVWYAIPTTLKSNVKWLHKKAFGQDSYKVSSTCKEISDEIIYNTGIG